MSDDRLHHLLDRARRGVILPDEAEQLAGLVGELEAAVVRLRTSRNRWAHHAGRLIGRAVTAEARATELEAEVTRLAAGQCIDSRRMCDLHHATPVTDCPYPRCIKARTATETTEV